MARISKFELSLVASVAFGALIPAESGFAADATSATANPQKVLVKKTKSAKAAPTRRTKNLAALRGGEEAVEVGGHSSNSVFSPVTQKHSTTQVTVVTGAELLKTGQTNVLSALAQANPAITTAALPGGGASSFVQTMQLRGQSPDDTLILVNGHRRHIGANFNSNSGTNWGSEPADISLIPVSAIDHIEVVTEGASALYGQDAIAGAVNIVLNADFSHLRQFRVIL